MMERSKEEMQKRLTELKKEFARKQKKLEKSKRAATIRAHVKQKVLEINAIDHYSSNESHKEIVTGALDNVQPLYENNKIKNVPFFLDNHFLPKASSKQKVDGISPPNSVSFLNSHIQDSNVNLMKSKRDNKISSEFAQIALDIKKKENVKNDSEEPLNKSMKSINKHLASLRQDSHVSSDLELSKCSTNLLPHSSAETILKTNDEQQINIKDLKCELASSIDLVKHQNKDKKDKPLFQSTLKSNKTESLHVLVHSLERLIEDSPSPIAHSSENSVAESQRFLEHSPSCSVDIERKRKRVHSESSNKANRLSGLSTVQKATELVTSSIGLSKDDDIVRLVTQSDPRQADTVSDSEFLDILGITETKNADNLSEVVNPINTHQKSSVSLAPSENQQSSSCSNMQSCLEQPEVKKLLPVTTNRSMFLDFTELDVIPYTKLELEEDFLSEESQDSKPPIFAALSKQQLSHSSKVRALVKRRSPRISVFQSLSQSISSQNNKYYIAKSKKNLSQQEKVAAVMSVFQFLKEEASKPNYVSDFELPKYFFKHKETRHYCYQTDQSNSSSIQSSEVNSDTSINTRYGSIREESQKSNECCVNSSELMENKQNVSMQHNRDIVCEKLCHSNNVLDKNNCVILNSELNIASLSGHMADSSMIPSKPLQNCLPNQLSSFTNNLRDHADVLISPLSPITHIVAEEIFNETPEHHSYQKTNVIKESPLPENKKQSIPQDLTPLLTTSTPKALKAKSFFPNSSLTDTLEKSDILFEDDHQVISEVESPVSTSKTLLSVTYVTDSECNNANTSTCLHQNTQSSLNPKNISQAIFQSPGQAMVNVSSASCSQGRSPMQLIEPWRKYERTPVTPLQVLEDPSYDGNQSPVVYLAARRLSRSQSTENEPKTLKFSGCFQSCSQDAVVNILSGSLVTKSKEIVQYLVSVQATSLTVWTKDDHFGWTTELDWRLPLDNHLFQAELLPASDTVVIVACGWSKLQLFVSLFVYNSDTQDTKRFNIEVSQLSDSIRSPTNAMLTVVSDSEILLSFTKDIGHVLAKVNFFDDFCEEKMSCFQKQRGQLLDVVTVQHQRSSCISLSANQNITIWNTNSGIAIKTIQLPASVPCLTKLLKAKTCQGTVFLETMWRVDIGCGGLLAVNPCNGSIRLIKTYNVPNNSWKSTMSAKQEVGLVVALSDTGSFCLWKCQNGKLVCHSKSHTTTALSVMKSEQSLLVGEIHGCVHLYKMSM
ncbi:phosphoribosyl pyrophosphate synthase-associated protein 1 [Biomphalaria glabrata]|nr:phosphoribosyl pyrophosphate synthase-associated protein 1 [Biomphalaria glabrata]